MAANSYVIYSGDGVTVQYTIPFDYIYENHVNVKVDGTPVDFLWTDRRTIELAFAPNDGAEVYIYRDSNIDSTVVTYQNNSIVSADDLNKQNKQMLYLIQEALEYKLVESEVDSRITDKINSLDGNEIVDRNAVWSYLIGSTSYLPEDTSTPTKTFLRDTPPEGEGESEGDIWIDISGKPYRYEDNGNWSNIAWSSVPEDPDTPSPGAGYRVLVRQAVEPDPDDFRQEDMWIDSDNGYPYIHDGISWIRTTWHSIRAAWGVIENEKNIINLDNEKLNAVIDGKTLVVGGYINTDFIETDALTADMIAVGDIDALQLLNGPAQPNADVTGDNTSFDVRPSAYRMIWEATEDFDQGSMNSSISTANNKLSLDI